MNSSQLLWEPKRLPLPEAPVPPRGSGAPRRDYVAGLYEEALGADTEVLSFGGLVTPRR